MHRIQPLHAGAAILDHILHRRTPIGGDALLRRIVHEIARIARRAGVALEGVQQPEPVPDFVHGRLAHLVAFQAAAGHAAREDVAPVEDVRGSGVRRGLAVAVGEFLVRGAGGGRVGDGLGEGAVAEELGGLGARGGDAGGEVGLEVDVEGGVGAAAEGGLHGAVLDVGCPGVVDGVAGGVQHEGDVGGGVRAVEDAALAGDEVGDVLRGVLRGLVGGRDEVDVRVDNDLLGEAGFAGLETVLGVQGCVGVEKRGARGARAALSDVASIAASRGESQGVGEGRKSSGEDE